MLCCCRLGSFLPLTGGLRAAHPIHTGSPNSWRPIAPQPGEKSEPYESNPVGQLLLTPDGHFSNVQMGPDLTSEASLQPKGGVVSNVLAYFGTYEMQGKDVTINVEGSTRADWQNKTLKRTVENVSPELVWVDRPAPDFTARATYGRCIG